MEPQKLLCSPPIAVCINTSSMLAWGTKLDEVRELLTTEDTEICEGVPSAEQGYLKQKPTKRIFCHS